MKYEEAFIAGFSDELEKQAALGLVARAALGLGRGAVALGKGLVTKVPKLVSGTKTFVQKVPGMLKSAPGAAVRAVKRDPLTAGFMGQSMLSGGAAPKPPPQPPTVQ